MPESCLNVGRSESACNGAWMMDLRRRVEGFELAAFGGHRRVNRRTTRIQIRRDALLLRQSGDCEDALPERLRIVGIDASLRMRN